MTDDMITEHLARAHLAESVTMDAETWTEVLQELQRYRQDIALQNLTDTQQEIEQEPVAWVGPSWLNPETRTWASESFAHKPIPGWIPLYIASSTCEKCLNQFIKGK